MHSRNPRSLPIKRKERHRVRMPIVGGVFDARDLTPPFRVIIRENHIAIDDGVHESQFQVGRSEEESVCRPPHRLSRRVQSCRRIAPGPCVRLATPWTPAGRVCGFRVSTRLVRPGNGRPIASKVRRPIRIGRPMVRVLNRRKSSGKCQGRVPSRPMTPLSASAATIVSFKVQPGWPARSRAGRACGRSPRPGCCAAASTQRRGGSCPHNRPAVATEPDASPERMNSPARRASARARGIASRPR